MFLKSYYEKILRKEKGAIIALTAVMIPIMLGFAGIGYDVGYLYLQKGKLQHIADSAAYAGSSVYYKDMIDTSITDSLKPNADYVVNDEGTGVNQVSEAHNTRRIAADTAATEFVNKNRAGLQTEVLALEGQVPVNAAGSSGSATTTTSDGVLYRVRVSEDFPLYFLRLIPGISNTQTVSADAVVAFTRGDSNKTTESIDYDTNYVNIFKNLFTTTNLSTGKLNGNGNEMDFAHNESLSSKIQNDVKTAEILDQFSYMIYLDNRNTGTPIDHASTTLEAGNKNDNYFNSSYYSYGPATLNGYYHPWDCRETEYRRWHVDINLTARLSWNHPKYIINIDKQLNNYDTRDGGVPFYIYKKLSGDVDINVTGKNANTNANCFPIILVNRNSYIGPDYNANTSTDSLYNETITVDIEKGKLFRGLIFAPYSTVVININQGTFKGSVVANKVTVNGTGTFIQENYFKDSNGQDAWWIKSFIPEDEDKPYIVENNGTKEFNSQTAAVLDYFFNEYLYNMTYNLAREDGNGNKLPTWYTWVYETLKVGGTYSNGFGRVYSGWGGTRYERTEKNGGYIDLSVSGTQNWFENLDTLSKARLAREWVNFVETHKNEAAYYTDEYGIKHYYRDENGEIIRVNNTNLPWVWSSNAAIHKEKEQEQEEVIKSYMMISSDSNSNLFKKYNL